MSGFSKVTYFILNNRKINSTYSTNVLVATQYRIIFAMVTTANCLTKNLLSTNKYMKNSKYFRLNGVVFKRLRKIILDRHNVPNHRKVWLNCETM